MVTALVVVDASNSYIEFTLYHDKYIISLSMVDRNGVSSILVSGVIGDKDRSLAANLQFYTTNEIIRSLLSVNGASIESTSIRVQRYTDFSLYKLNGTINLRIRGKLLKLLLSFDIMVSGNDSSEVVRARGAVTPVSGERELALAVLVLVEDSINHFVDILKNMSLGLIESRKILVEHVPTPHGISARVDVVLDVRSPDNAWKEVVSGFIDPVVIDYLNLLFDHRLGDYVLGVELRPRNNTLAGNVTVLFNKGFEELLGLNNTLLSSDFIITYYEVPSTTVFNASNIVLKPHDGLENSLREIGLLLYRLIGNTSLPIIVKSKDMEIGIGSIGLKPVKWNGSYAEWNTSEALLYLGKIMVSERVESSNYLFVIVAILAASVCLFYVVRRVSSK